MPNPNALQLCLVLIAAGVAHAATAAPTPIQVSATTIISIDRPQVPHGESFLAVNPANPANMLATACKVGPEGAGATVYATHDGGRTWQRGLLQAGAEVLAEGWDAITYFDAGGIGYFGSNNSDGLWVSRSTDGGRTWGAATLIAGAEGFDRQFMAIDNYGRFKGRIYAAATVMAKNLEGKAVMSLAIAPSDDGGETFKQPYLIQGAGKENPFTFGHMLVARDGTAVFPFTTTTAMSENPRDKLWNWRVATSGDGGRSYAITPIVHSFRQPAEGYRADKTMAGFSSAIDLSTGPFADRLYLVWTEMKGDRNDVKLMYSTDLGKSWSKPVTVNDNSEAADHSNPMVAVNEDGAVGVVWNDRRAHRDACYDLYFSASLDGGRTFLPNVTTGRKPTCAPAPGNWVMDPRVVDYPRTEDGAEVHGQGLNVLMVATRFANGGETQGLAAGRDGVFHAAWIDGASGVMQLALTSFTVDGKPDASAAAARHVSVQVKLRTEKCGFDWDRKTFSCEVYLENVSQSPVDGPLAITLQEARVNLPGFTATNADNEIGGVGALWSMPLDGKSLAPGTRSPVRTLNWRLSGMGEEPDYPFILFDVIRRAN